MIRRLRENQRGATAIEYAIIAGLIGLGLVGSLVTTRGSLSSIFGTASSQMGSATTTQKPVYTGPTFNPALARSSYWSGKTLTSGPTITDYGSYKQVTATFSDKSEVYYTYFNDGHSQIMTRDGSTLFAVSTVLSASGSPTYSDYYHYVNTNFSNTDYYYYANQYNSSGPSLATYTVCSGGCSSSSVTAPANYIAAYQNSLKDIAVYNDILTR